MHAMIDLETLALTQDAAIVQIGAVAFELRAGGAIDVAGGLDILVDPNAPRRRHCSHTVGWWHSQDPALYEKVVARQADRVRLGVALARLHDWLDRINAEHGLMGVWAGPAAFDLGVLRHAYEQLGRAIPWNYRIERDDRTVRALSRYGLLAPRPFDALAEQPALPPRVEHDALNDAIYQARALQDLLGVPI